MALKAVGYTIGVVHNVTDSMHTHAATFNKTEASIGKSTLSNSDSII